MKPSRSRLLALAVALSACSDESTLPTALAPQMSVPPTSNSACNVHWASGVNGSWFDATKWNPAGVPGSTASVCIDAAGTYTVTMDPTVDTTPIDILALDVGGAGAIPTLRMTGSAATLNITEGIVVQQNATLLINTSGAGIINATGTITNSGTIDALAPCGGCGQGHAINADIINTSVGTLSVRTTLLTLGKVGGAYANSGTITSGTTSGVMVIPAAAGNASFSQDAGVITGASNFETFTILSGTFTLNGGKARTRNGTSNLKPIVIIDGANLVIAATATDSATIGVRASSSAATTITGDIPALTTLWLAGPQNLQPGTITFNDAAPVNNGGIRLGSIDGGQGILTIGGSGRLTNADTMYANISGATDTFHFALEFTNSGKMHLLQHVSFEKPGGMYYNAGLIAGSGTVRMVVTTLVSTATGTVSPTNTAGAPHFVVDGGRLIGTGTVGRVTLLNGGTVEPGLSAGILNATNLSAPLGTALKIELGGPQVGTEYDQLNLAIGASTAGSLDVSEINGFLSGVCGQVFEVLTWNTTHTGFASYTGLNPAPTRALRAFVTPATNPRKTILYGHDPTTKISVAPNPVAIAEGGPATQYAVCLDGVPALSAGQTVTVHAAPNAQVTVSPDSVKFTSSDWRSPKFFTVTAVDDNVVEGNHTGAITHTATSNVAAYNGATISSLTANITDNDNSTPVAVDDNAQTTSPNAVVVSVLANDSDLDGDPLSVTSVTQPANGTVQITGSGQTVTYTPNAAFVGNDSFTYTISDGQGGAATATVSVNVRAANRPPVAVDDNAQTATGNPVTIDVLANDSDPDSDPLTIASVTQPANGSAQINSATQRVIYTPATGFVGNDQFTYTIDDGKGGSASANVFVTVNPSAPGNRPPLAVSDFYLLTDGRSFNLNVLANDSDPDGDPLTIVSVTQPPAVNPARLGPPPTVSIGRKGQLVYSLPPCYWGMESFTYTISDGRGGTATASVTVTVAPTIVDVCIVDVQPKLDHSGRPVVGITVTVKKNSATLSYPPLLGIKIGYPRTLPNSLITGCADTKQGTCVYTVPAHFSPGTLQFGIEWFSFAASSGSYRFNVQLVTGTSSRLRDYDTSNNAMAVTVTVP